MAIPPGATHEELLIVIRVVLQLVELSVVCSTKFQDGALDR